MADTCLTCVNRIAAEAGKGTCHNSPPVPVGEYRLDTPSEWPKINDTDLCAQFVAGTHGGLTCNSCANYIAIVGEVNTGECHASPPVPVGEYKGDLSSWPRVNGTDKTCLTCFVP